MRIALGVLAVLVGTVGVARRGHHPRRLRSAGVRVGSDREARIGLWFLVFLATVGLILVVHAATEIL